MNKQPEKQSRMFHVGGKPMKTWNCFVGCRFDCTYCNARKTALTRLRKSPRYKDGFAPQPVAEEMGRRFRPGDFVFIAYMGDIAFASRPTVGLILSQVREQPDVNFLFCSKEPRLYLQWDFDWPNNLYLAATIETDIDFGLSNAPPPGQRYNSMRYLEHPKKLISIEPICEFNLVRMLKWVYDIGPEIVEVGADNYHNHLPEPPWEKVEQLLVGLRSICPNVVEKVGLHRLENVTNNP